MPNKPHAPAATPARRRRWPLLLPGALLLLTGLHAAAWAWAASRLEAGLALWALLRRAEGWEVAHGTPTRGGWPLRAAVTVPEVTMRRQGFGWQAEAVTLSLSPAAPGRLHLIPAGRQVLEAGGQAVPVQAEAMHAHLPLGRDAIAAAGLPRDAALQAERIRFDLPGGPLVLTAPRFELASGDGMGPADPLAVLRGRAASATLAPGLAAMPGLRSLGSSLDRIGLELALAGPWPGLAGTPAARVTRWRDGGGTLELRALGFGWGAARLDASGLFGLDAALQPAGEAMLRLTGAAAVLDAAREAGMIGRREAGGAQMLLALMQRSPPEGGPPRLEVQAVLERRSLTLAGLPLLRLPPLRWSGLVP